MKRFAASGIVLAKRVSMKAPIHYKITLIFGVVIGLILSGAYFYLNDSLSQYSYQRIKANLIKQANLASSVLEGTDFSIGQYEKYDALADKIGSDFDARVTVIGVDGKVLGDSELPLGAIKGVENHFMRPEVQEALRLGIGESRRFSETIKKDMLYVVARFGHDGLKGFVRLSVPLVEIDLISNRLRKTLGFSLMVVFVFALFISFLTSILISKPIQKMSFVAQAIARGDYSKKIIVSSEDEIGELAKVINYMSGEVQTRVQEVVSSKLRLEAVLLSMFEGVMVIDTNSEILLMNQPLRVFLDIKDDWAGKKPLEIVRNLEIQEVADKVLKSKSGVESCQISIFAPQEKVLSVHAASVVRDNKVDGAVLVFHDITALRQLEKMRQDFVANVSHELRTPVSTIKGYAETLLEGALEDKENAKDFLKIIRDDADRLARLIEDLLDLSKIESGKLALKREDINWELLVQRCVAHFKKQIDAKSLSVKIDIAHNLPKILADSGLIAHVLMNLVDNAVKYIDDDGHITISVLQDDGRLKVEVSDTGIGIPEEDIPRIFERFYRVDKARSRELGGTGLGLSIVKHIVQAHHGEVAVASILGKGSTFSFILP